MIKKIFFTLILSSFLTVCVLAAGSSDSDSSKVKTDYDKAVSFIDNAKKYEASGKTDKVNKSYKKALKLLTKSNLKKPNNADTLNYLGFTTRKLGDYKNGEKYYLQGLALQPNHIGINEYLGELYVQTGRIDEAKKRLKVLENCKCKEFEELKSVISTGNSKY